MSAGANDDAPDVKLKEIASRLRDGEKVEPITARELLRWFAAERRGSWIISRIMHALYSHNLRTEPHFLDHHLDRRIELRLGKDERDKSPPVQFVAWLLEELEDENPLAAISSGEGQFDRKQAIQERAYAIWEEEARPEGRQVDHWLRAEAEINSFVR
jgi:hypothetical protein